MMLTHEDTREETVEATEVAADPEHGSNGNGRERGDATEFVELVKDAAKRARSLMTEAVQAAARSAQTPGAVAAIRTLSAHPPPFRPPRG